MPQAKDDRRIEAVPGDLAVTTTRGTGTRRGARTGVGRTETTAAMIRCVATAPEVTAPGVTGPRATDTRVIGPGAADPRPQVPGSAGPVRPDSDLIAAVAQRAEAAARTPTIGVCVALTASDGQMASSPVVPADRIATTGGRLKTGVPAGLPSVPVPAPAVRLAVGATGTMNDRVRGTTTPEAQGSATPESGEAGVAWPAVERGTSRVMPVRDRRLRSFGARRLPAPRRTRAGRLAGSRKRPGSPSLSTTTATTTTVLRPIAAAPFVWSIVILPALGGGQRHLAATAGRCPSRSSPNSKRQPGRTAAPSWPSA